MTAPRPYMLRATLSSALATAGVALGAAVIRATRGASSEPRAIGDTGLLVTRNVIVDLYAARTSGGVVLFDTGLDVRGRPVDRLLAAINATRDDVTDVFITHAHPDHVAGAHLFLRARIHAGAPDRDLLAGRARCRRPAVRVFAAILPSRPVHLSAPLEGARDVGVGLGDESVFAVPMPGDTPGAYAYLFRRVLIVGDGLSMHRGELVTSPPWSMEDPLQNRRSIARLSGDLRGRAVDYLASSHGGVTPKGTAERLLAEAADRASAALPSLPDVGPSERGGHAWSLR